MNEGRRRTNPDTINLLFGTDAVLSQVGEETALGNECRRGAVAMRLVMGKLSVHKDVSLTQVDVTRMAYIPFWWSISIILAEGLGLRNITYCVLQIGCTSKDIIPDSIKEGLT